MRSRGISVGIACVDESSSLVDVPVDVADNNDQAEVDASGDAVVDADLEVAVDVDREFDGEVDASRVAGIEVVSDGAIDGDLDLVAVDLE
jgi:hypothetical protein